jgi:hypothetical protein
MHSIKTDVKECKNKDVTLITQTCSSGQLPKSERVDAMTVYISSIMTLSLPQPVCTFRPTCEKTGELQAELMKTTFLSQKFPVLLSTITAIGLLSFAKKLCIYTVYYHATSQPHIITTFVTSDTTFHT